MNQDLRVRDLGEQGLLQRVQQFCPEGMVGDDAALLKVDPGQSLVVTTDVLIDEVHFSDRTTSAFDVGWRAIAANLSDLAAMGADPIGATVGLGLAGEVPVCWVEGLYEGMTACLKPYETPIIGGDICRSPTITISITALGQVAPEFAIRRSVAQPGYAIVATGGHGASRAGLELLLHPEKGQGLTEDDRASLIQKHQRPQPRLDVVPLLREIQSIQENSLRHSIAGMDSSDGLADAILQICRASGVGAEIDRAQLPIPSTLLRWISPEQAIEWALYGGEDFELVLCLPVAEAEKLVARLGKEATMVGLITAGSKVVLCDRTRRLPDQLLTLERGFQHFSATLQ